MKMRPETALGKIQRQDKTAECPCCHRFQRLTVDHIIPVHILEQMGFFEECYEDTDNFQLMCRRCNQYKGGRLDFSNPKTIVLLEKYVNQIKKGIEESARMIEEQARSASQEILNEAIALEAVSIQEKARQGRKTSPKKKLISKVSKKKGKSVRFVSDKDFQSTIKKLRGGDKTLFEAAEEYDDIPF